mmetsp:Transcript_7953/g.13355  ORF Transcript_7953/g.13355 Transcript_7953/m.13355 type:complete len:145 (+) Transcript_7953:757-1191(+)
MNQGKDSVYYKKIQANFEKVDPSFTEQSMELIVGPKSLMFQLNTTFSFNVGYNFKFNKNIPTPDQLLIDQWSNRRLTSNTDILLFDKSLHALPKSIFDLYQNNVNSSFEAVMRNEFVVPLGYQPELNYFLVEVLGFQESKVEMS